MTRRLLWTGACMLVALLAFPRTGSAGIGEIILEMSGPQMIGAISGCTVSTHLQVHRCYVFGYPLPKRSDRGKTWLLLESGQYISDGKNSEEEPNERDFRGFHNFMVTADPMVGFTSKIGDHAIGVSYNFVFGTDFGSFSNFAIKVRPVVVQWLKLDWEYNIRLYPKGFDAVNGPNGPILSRGDDFEVVHGISVTVPF